MSRALAATIPDSYLAPIIVALLIAILGFLAWVVRTVSELTAAVKEHLGRDEEQFRAVNARLVAHDRQLEHLADRVDRL